MKLSYNWLNEYIDLSDLEIANLADTITMKICEVEEYEEFYPFLQQIVIARVESVKPHPNADKLVITQVSDGKEQLQIVTGAPNVVKGKLYPLAKIGVTLPGGLTIQPAKLRGIESNGMLCSSQELNLTDLQIGDSHVDGLWTLPDNYRLGASLRDELHMNDFIIDIDNKSITHRPDLWGHFGFARELSSILGKKLKSEGPAPFAAQENLAVDASALTMCSIEKNAAIAYSSTTFTGVQVNASAEKIQTRLLALGMRPINNVVDISNYVMLDLGQPNHAFDRNFLKKGIAVSFSKAGEKITLLDERELTLPDGIVLIRDGEKPVALGGVMGGAETEVAGSTTSLFFESATFHRTHIRKAVASLGIRTEASQRFEKGQDPENTEKAIWRFAELLQESCPDLKMQTIHTVNAEEAKQNTISTTLSYIRERLGQVELSDDKIRDILNGLGMTCTLNGDQLEVQTPVYRSYFDVTIPEDLVEEIGRVIGYNEIQPEPLMVSCEVPARHNETRKMEHRLRNLFANSYGFSEVYNYAFHSETDINVDQRFASTGIQLKNPIHKDLEYMRISPLPGLLRNISQNYKEHDELRFFEIERIFLPQGDKSGKKDEKSLPTERYFLAGVIAPEITSEQSDENTLGEIASVLSDLLQRLGVDSRKQVRLAERNPVLHPGRAGVIHTAEGKELIRWGEVHPRLVKSFHIQKRVFYLEMFLDDLLSISGDDSTYTPVFKYPASDFEVTLLVDRKSHFADIASSIGEPYKAPPNPELTFLESIKHLTTYIGESIEPGKKAVSLSVQWRNASRTLEHDEIKKLQEGMIESLKQAGYSLR